MAGPVLLATIRVAIAAMTDLAIIVPSRGRPANLERLWHAVNATAAGSFRFVACLDSDDYANYPQLKRIEYMIAPRMRLAAWYNYAAESLAFDHRYLALWADDVVPETPGWDEALLGELEQVPFGVAYGDDCIQHENLPTHPIVTSSMFHALGWVTPPQLEHLYIDNAWKDLGQWTDSLKYRPDVITRHHHWIAGLAENDEVYRDANDGPRAEADQIAYHGWRSSDVFAQAVMKLRALAA